MARDKGGSTTGGTAGRTGRALGNELTSASGHSNKRQASPSGSKKKGGGGGKKRELKQKALKARQTKNKARQSYRAAKKSGVGANVALTAYRAAQHAEKKAMKLYNQAMARSLAEKQSAVGQAEKT